MKNNLRIFIAIAIFALATASFIELQGRAGAPRDWKKIERASDLENQEISFTFNLRQCNLDELRATLLRVSDPHSDEYGQYLTLNQVNELVMCPGDRELVMEFINQFEVKKVTLLGPAIKVTTTIGVAQDMLQTQFHQFQHKTSNTIFTRQIGGVHIREELSNVVSFISGISEFFHQTKFTPISYKSPKIHAANGDYNPNSIPISDPYVTPNYLYSKYGVPNEPIGNADNYLGIGAFDNDYDDYALCRFQDLFGNYGESPIIQEIGPFYGSDQIESDLDIQYSTAMAKEIVAVFANHPPGEWILDWAQATVQSDDDDKPLVWSLSYGWPEVFQCAPISGNQTITNCPTGYDYQQYINATNYELMKLGSMGISVLVSSGDDGTPGFAVNCPLDPNQYYTAAQTSCASVFEDAVCNCGELILEYTATSGETTTCLFPNGFLYGTGCGDLSEAALTLCYEAYNEFINTQVSGPNDNLCNTSSSFIGTGYPYFYSNCSCEDFNPVTFSLFGASCTVSGYEFDVDNGPAFLPDYPTSSPYVTSVGAVAMQFSNDCDTDTEAPEIYCQATNPSGFSGGGGFSSFQLAEDYQQYQINKYVASAPYLPPDDTFDPAYRGYPDVAFNGHNYVTAIGVSVVFEGDQPTNINGLIQPVSGTSASSPAFAGLVAHLNDYLLANNLPSLGFLNPLLYTMSQENPNTFTDITPQEIDFMNGTVEAGEFSGCTQNYCCQYGFAVTDGWDPATGLGTPYFPEMLSYIQKMWKMKKVNKN